MATVNTHRHCYTLDVSPGTSTDWYGRTTALWTVRAFTPSQSWGGDCAREWHCPTEDAALALVERLTDRHAHYCPAPRLLDAMARRLVRNATQPA